MFSSEFRENWEERTSVSPEEFAENILKDLGLTWEDLEGKEILEIGAGPAILAQVAKNRGINVVSIDIDPDSYREEGKIVEDIEYIQADVADLPFGKGTFDLVLSRAAPPAANSHTPELVEGVIKEVTRVLKNDGEFRFGKAPLLHAVSGLVEYGPVRDTMEAIRIESMKLLTEIDPNITKEQSIPYTTPFREEAQAQEEGWDDLVPGDKYYHKAVSRSEEAYYRLIKQSLPLQS